MYIYIYYISVQFHIIHILRRSTFDPDSTFDEDPIYV